MRFHNHILWQVQKIMPFAGVRLHTTSHKFLSCEAQARDALPSDRLPPVLLYIRIGEFKVIASFEGNRNRACRRMTTAQRQMLPVINAVTK